MPATVTAADIDDVALRYFVKEDNTDWLPGTDLEKSADSASPVKPRVGSIAQDMQDDLTNLIDLHVDTLTP